MSQTGLQAINLVSVATADQDAAIAFYEGIGFEKRADIPFGGNYRWVEVYPPEGPTGIALAPPPEGATAGGMQTGVVLGTSDIDATHAAMQAAGVDVDEVSRMGDPVPPMFFFRDPERNTLLVVQSQA